VNTTFDAILVGAGPAGSTAARLLAQRGARVLMLDRARFPRDKPCGGGVTIAAASEAGLDLTPVVERTVTRARVSFRLGSAFERTSMEPLSYMTQRRLLDAYLAEQAIAAGAAFHDGVAVREVTVDGGEAVVRANGGVYSARALVGADGANGIVARALGLTPAGETAVALEANVPADGELLDRWRDAIALDFGGIPGGYGWLFPKGDHLNVGVGGWAWVGPTLRERLSALCRHLEIDEAQIYGLRGHHLPLRAPGAPISGERAALVGDAAGLVDPLSGEGIHAAFVSGRLAAESIGRYLDGRSAGLRDYEAAVERELMPDILISRKLQAIFHRMPRPCVAVMRRSDTFWRSLVRIVRGESTYSNLRRSLGPLRPALDLAAYVSRRTPRGAAGQR
jgi:geranylgeranyl reductase family protein